MQALMAVCVRACLRACVGGCGVTLVGVPTANLSTLTPLPAAPEVGDTIVATVRYRWRYCKRAGGKGKGTGTPTGGWAVWGGGRRGRSWCSMTSTTTRFRTRARK